MELALFEVAFVDHAVGELEAALALLPVMVFGAFVFWLWPLRHFKIIINRQV